MGQLSQGLRGNVEGTNPLFYIKHENIPPDCRKDIIYARICINHRPEKADPNHCKISVGGNLIKYPGDVGTRTADMLTVKLLFNSIISTPGAKFMSLDVYNFYPMTPMDRYTYLQMNLLDVPENVIQQYKLCDMATKDGGFTSELTDHKLGFLQTRTLKNG